jgi:PhnB protein
MDFNPYLFFGGNCREAFTRYHEIFGGDVVILRMGDTPDAGDVPPEQADLVIHAAITVGDALLMGSDDPMSESFGPVQGMMVT